MFHSQWASRSARVETLSKRAARALEDGLARVEQRGKSVFVYIEAHGNHTAQSVQVMSADDLVASLASRIRRSGRTLCEILDLPSVKLAFDVSGLTIDELNDRLTESNT